MDHDTRTKAATEQDPKLAARIVRSLKQVEDDNNLASGPLSERLMSAVVQLIKKAVTEPFQVTETDWTAIITLPAWRATRGVGQDFWIELTEIGADEEREYSWLAAATGAGSTLLGLELMFRRGLQETAQTIIADDKQMSAIWKAGFVRSEEDFRLFISIAIQQELLAQGFEQNDLAKALAPVTKAVEQAIAARAELDALIEKVRTAAKLGK